MWFLGEQIGLGYAPYQQAMTTSKMHDSSSGLKIKVTVASVISLFVSCSGLNSAIFL